MGLKLEIDEVRLSTETRPYRRAPVVDHEAMESVITNRRRALTGIAVSCAILLGAVVWQYVDGRGAFPDSAQTDRDGAVIGSVAVEADGSLPNP